MPFKRIETPWTRKPARHVKLVNEYSRYFTNLYTITDFSKTIRDYKNNSNIAYNGTVGPTTHGIAAKNTTITHGTFTHNYNAEWGFLFHGVIKSSGKYTLHGSNLSGYFGVQVGTTSGEISVYYPGAYRARTGTGEFAVGDKVTIVITYDTVNDHRLWVNGTERTFTTNSATTYTAGSLGSYFLARHSTGEQADADCLLYGVGNLIPSSIAQKLSLEPLLLLSPDIEYIPYSVAAGGAAVPPIYNYYQRQRASN